MELNKYKITTAKSPGHMIVVYQDGHFKSVLNEFNPPLTEKQLNIILNHITDDPAQLAPLIKEKYEGKIFVEAVKPIGVEPGIDNEGYTTNHKIGLFCQLYANHHKDSNGSPVKYKTGAAEAGKMKALAVGPDELEQLLLVYFKADEWWSKPKSITNFIKKYNEVRALAFAKPAINFPIPYSPSFFNGLDLMGKRQYQDFLKLNGYEFKYSPAGGSGSWIKSQTLTQ